MPLPPVVCSFASESDVLRRPRPDADRESDRDTMGEAGGVDIGVERGVIVLAGTADAGVGVDGVSGGEGEARPAAVGDSGLLPPARVSVGFFSRTFPSSSNDFEEFDGESSKTSP
jgi:hypothetical protein